MNPPVFAHGHLRLYLLSLLEEQPRHGYELIQALSERFDGTYSPSAGTIYPRLAKLEEEGLVTKHNDGRKSVYRITEAGRAELDSRRDELDSIERDVDSSVRRLASEVRQGLTNAREELRAEFARLAQELGPEVRSGFEAGTHAAASGAASARGFFSTATRGWGDPRDGYAPPGEPRAQDAPDAPEPSPDATPDAQARRSALAALTRSDLVLNSFRHDLRQDFRTAQASGTLSDDLVSFLEQELARVREVITRAVTARDQA